MPAKKEVSAIVLILLLTGIITLAPDAPMVKADTNPKMIFVDVDNITGPWDGTFEHPYQNITSAVQQACVGDAIYACAGIYYETLVINKTVTIIGENKTTTIVDGGGEGNVVEFKADNINITSFTIRNSKNDWPYSGLALVNVKNCNIFGNNITNNNYGIRLSEGSENNSIRANIIQNNWAGIAFSFASNNSIMENNVTANKGFGIFFQLSLNNSISENNIVANGKYGIELDFSSDYNRIIRNNITAHTGDGIGFDHSSSNIIFRNNVSANAEYGMRVYGTSQYNRISGNHITNNRDGMRLAGSSNNNRIFHNNFVDNQRHASTHESNNNSWDDYYPSGGNYWSNYTDVDSDNDGIGNKTYQIDAYNVDRYPLVGQFNTFDAGIFNGTCSNIDIISNLTISNFQLANTSKTIVFKVSSSKHSLSFCRVTIPTIIVQDFWRHNYTVLVNDQTVGFKNWTYEANTYIYFVYQHSDYTVVIVPELLLPLMPLPLLFFTLFIIIFKKRKISGSE